MTSGGVRKLIGTFYHAHCRNDGLQMMIGVDEFLKVDMRVGRIVRAEVNAAARKPAYKLWVDFGGETGELKSSAQLTVHYTPESLTGKLVVGVVNFPARQIGPVRSECLVLGVPDENGDVVLLSPDGDIPLGGRVF